jgi:hypothetical protein
MVIVNPVLVVGSGSSGGVVVARLCQYKATAIYLPAQTPMPASDSALFDALFVRPPPAAVGIKSDGTTLIVGVCCDDSALRERTVTIEILMSAMFDTVLTGLSGHYSCV